MSDLMTPVELSEQLKMSTDMLKLWRHKKTGPPYIKLGASVRYSQKAVDKWLVGQTRETAAA